jgi:hypothetical protein
MTDARTRQLLARALEHAPETHTLEDVIDQIARGDAQVWQTEESVLVTEVYDTPRMRVIHVWLAAGEMGEVIALSHQALSWGRKLGCKRASLAGRRGWERKLAAEGWTPELTLMGKPI